MSGEVASVDQCQCPLAEAYPFVCPVFDREMHAEIHRICRGLHPTEDGPCPAGLRERYVENWRKVASGEATVQPAITPESLGEGPGTELVAIFAEKGAPGCQRCIDLAREMNAAGAAWCRENVEAIVADILPRAKTWLAEERPWARKVFGVVDAMTLGKVDSEDAVLSRRIRKYVLQAIEQSEGGTRAAAESEPSPPAKAGSESRG